MFLISPFSKSITILASFSVVGFPLNATYAVVSGILSKATFVKSSTFNSSFPIVIVFVSDFFILSTVIGSITSSS